VAGHILLEISTRAIIFLPTSYQSEVCTQSYGSPKSRESQLWEFRDSPLGIPRQNDIWVLVLWPCTKYTIRGKVMASPKFGPCWVLWICVYVWFVCASRCSNYALTNLFGLCRSVWVIELLVNRPSPHPGALTHSSTPEMLRSRGRTQFFLFLLSSPLDSQLNPSKNLGVL
jgi:hypothetical protein